MATSNTNAAVGASSTKIVDGNKSRKSLIIVNDSTSIIYIGIGAAAVANKGIRLNANGGSLEMSRTGDFFSSAAIYGISDGAAKNVTVCEVA